MTLKPYTLLLLFLSYCPAHAQVAQDPVLDTVQQVRGNGSYKAGQTYYKWIVDLNHDGVNDVLVSPKESADEIKQEEENLLSFDPDVHGFWVYIGRKSGGYIRAGDADLEGVDVNVSECYVGYIKQVKAYGIVTTEARIVHDSDVPQAKHGTLKQVVCCYYLKGSRLVRKDLTSWLYPDEDNSIYDEYLSISKRTKVTLEEVKP